MRIALVTDTYTPQVNGVTAVVRRIADLLQRDGHDVVVVAPAYPERGRGPAELRIASVPFPPYPAVRLSVPARRPVFRFLDARAPELVHVATEGPLGLVGRRYALARRIPLVTSYHTDFPAYARHYGATALVPLVRRWLTWFHRPARLVQTPGEAIRDDLRRQGLEQAVVWGRGVDCRQFDPVRRDTGWRRWLAGGDDTTVVLHVGRLAPEKNLDVLVEAWRLAHAALDQRATFVVAGEGPEARRVVQALPFVRQLGFLDRDRLAVLYASADVCVLPSRTETCGLVALEAMASGIPVVAADAGGFRESIQRDVNGVLTPSDDPRAFARAIADLVCDPARRRALGAAARVRALERDTAREDQELIAQYRGLTGVPEALAPCAA
jgi:glycosyltransferase involved in cell wall biosynthesis